MIWQRWRSLVGGSLLLVLVAFQTSMAGMELIAWLLCLLALIGQPQASNFAVGTPIPREIKVALGGLLVSVFVSVALCRPEFRDWENFAFMRWIVLFLAYNWLLRGFLNNEAQLTRAASLWMICLSLVGAYTVFQGLTGIDWIRPSAHVPVAVGAIWRSAGPMSFSITFASVAAMATAMTVGWLLKSQKVRWWYWGAALAGVLAVLFTLSRASFLALIVMALAAAWLTRPRLVPWVLLGLGLAAVFVFFAFDGVAIRMSSLLHLERDHSTALRFGIWRSYWAMIVDHPWFGVGLFVPSKILPEYYQRLGIVESFTSHAHDNLLQWAAGSGIFAAACYLGLSGRLVLASWRGFRLSLSPVLRGLAFGTLLAQLVFHIEGLIECNFFDGEVNHQLVFWWALALAIELQLSRPKNTSAVDSI